MLQRLGKYEIIRPLGHGSMGEVYLATDTVIGREVAIKTILPGRFQGNEAEHRFRLEATVAGKLNHPNIVTVFEFDKHDQTHYLVMEWVKGEDLAVLLEARALSHKQCLEVLAQVCEGLACAHNNGIIHRDIKPSNVRVLLEAERVHAKIMDFGIARCHEGNSTATGILLGTVNYMAPEYIRTGKASSQSDLFAVGVMLHECLTGERLYESDSTTSSFFKIVTETIPTLDTTFIRDISPQINSVLSRALAKDPEARFPNGESLAKALRSCMDPDWRGPIGTRVTVPSWRPLLHTLRPHRKGLAATAGAAILVAGIVWLRSFPSKQAAPQTTANQPLLAQLSQTPFPSTPGVPPRSFKEEKPSQGNSIPDSPMTEPPPVPEKPVVTPSEAPKPAEPIRLTAELSDSEKLAKAVALIEEDPKESVELLRKLSVDHPGDAQIQGNLLAAVYRTRNAAEFERTYSDVKTSGLNMTALLKVASFRTAIQEETRLHRNKSLYRVLPGDLLTRILNTLVPPPGPEQAQ